MKKIQKDSLEYHVCLVRITRFLNSRAFFFFFSSPLLFLLLLSPLAGCSVDCTTSHRRNGALFIPLPAQLGNCSRLDPAQVLVGTQTNKLSGLIKILSDVAGRTVSFPRINRKRRPSLVPFFFFFFFFSLFFPFPPSPFLSLFFSLFRFVFFLL